MMESRYDNSKRTTNVCHDPTDPTRVEAKIRQGVLQKALAHTVISTLHIQFDYLKTMMNEGLVQIMHQFLSNEDIRDTMATNKNPISG